MLSNIQELVERSIYEVIRNLLVTEGYLPDIKNPAFIKDVKGNLVPTSETAWQAAITQITNIQSFSAELFGASSSQSKGLKRTPRIALNSGKIMVGDLGLPPGQTISKNPLSPNEYRKFDNPLESSTVQIEIHCVSDTIKQERFLNAIIGKALGQKRYIPFIGSTDKFFTKYITQYDIPDAQEGINENVYVYEAQDLYLFDEGNNSGSPISLITEITMETSIPELLSMINNQGQVIGPYQQDGTLYIDLSTVKIL